MKCLLPFLLALMAFATGCSLDEGDSPAGSSSPGGGMTFVLTMPDPNTGPASYALTDAEENTVGTLDVFAFKKESFDNYILKEHAEVDASTIETNATNTRYKSFRVNFYELKENLNYVFVIIANGRDLIGDPATYADRERDEIMETFTLADIHRWVDKGRPIPMWGETKELKLENNMKIEGVKLLRMLAKVDVNVVGAGTQNDFKLQSVRLYNYRSGSYVVPSRGKFTTADMETVKAPTLYGEREEYPEKDPLLFTGSKDLTDKGCVSQIYIPETDVPYLADGTTDLDQVHCVVIGGKYKGGKETFYRVNFVRKDGDKTVFIDLLRNHRYTLNIINVHGNGYDTVDDAFKAKAMNMEAEVKEWNDAKMTEFAFDGQNILTVTKGEWGFMKEERLAGQTYDDNMIDIYTDVDGGWTVEKCTDASDQAITWLDITPTTGAKNATVAARLTLTTNTTSAPRTGYIHLKAGRLVYKVKVTQSNIGFVPVSSINLNKTTTSITEGLSEQITVTSVLPADATNKALTWESSDMTVATVTQEGKIYAHKPGTAVITAKATDGSGKTATCTVTVVTSQIFVTKVTLDKTTATVTTGIPLQLKETVAPENATNKKVTWTSSDPTVASVDATGLVSVYKTGTATITVTTDDGQKTATCTINAKSVVTHVMLNKDELNIVAGDTKKLIPTVMPVDVANKSVTWKSSDEAVAKVAADGTITAISTGTAVITVTTDEGGKTATCTVTVSAQAIPIESIVLKTTTTLKVESHEKLQPIINPGNATNQDLIWTSDKPSVASVAADGMVTAHTTGTAVITVTSVADNTKKAQCTVTVNTNAITLTGLLITGTTSLIEGNSAPLSVTYTPSNATNKAVTWSSDKVAVASVDANGLVTAHTAGTAIITATSAEGPKATHTITVTSTFVAVTGIDLKTSTSINVSGFEKLTPTITPSGATNKAVTWTSSHPLIASVAADGTVYGHIPGKATITATTQDQGKTATCEVTVKSTTMAVTGVSLNKNSLALKKDNSEKLIATIAPADATNKVVSWASSDTDVATVSSDGTVTAVANGTATITVTTQDGNKTEECIVTVTTDVTGLTLTPDEASVEVGNTVQLTATVLPSDASSQAVNWSSSNTGIATIADGVVTGVSAGTAVITAATAVGGFSQTSTIKVTAPIPPGLTITLPNSDIVPLWQLTKTLTPIFNIPGTYTVDWISDNEDVATVANGVVTPIKEGMTKITAKVGTVTSNICYLTVSDSAPSELADWAGSNIYWDGTKLTFDDEFVTDHETYQGVCFKWGSLWGIAGDGSKTVYKPGNVVSTSEWGDIPYLTSGNSTDKGSIHLYNNTDAVSISAQYGDICKFLTEQNGGLIHGKKWRMPSATELLNTWSGGDFSGIRAAGQTGNAGGTVAIEYGRKVSGSILPASGYRNGAGIQGSGGQHGLYYASSPEAAQGYYLGFDKAVPTIKSVARVTGCTVRCVVDK